MAWTDGVDRATGYIVSSSNWNDLLGASGSLMQLKSHAHGGTTGEGSTSLGPLVLGDFTDAAAPAAPGAGKTRLFATGGRPHYRAGAAGADFEYLVEDMFDAKGDIITSTAADAWVRKAAGADDTILMADSASGDGLKWVAPATPAAVGTANLAGSTDDFTRGDHVHAHEAAHINHDTTWAAKGDIIAATANDAAAVVTVGANDTVLTADSAQSSGVKWAAPQAITLATEQATTTGTSKDFTGIPSGTKHIVVMLVGLSTNGSSNLLVQIGDSGGIETTGYSGGGHATNAGAYAFNAAGFTASTIVNTQVWHGRFELYLEDASDNTWVCVLQLGDSSNSGEIHGSGSKALSAVLDRVRLTTVNGTDAFDAGSVNISYQ